MGKLRIIAGKWRSRVLPVVDLPGLRPTTDRVRETLFNWLQNDIPGAKCLDLFAGSGALGFEAASRGAASVVMLEQQPLAAKALQQNIVKLQAENIQLLQMDSMEWLDNPRLSTIARQATGIGKAGSGKSGAIAAQGGEFDIVFIDPPFSRDYLLTACKRLDAQGLLSAHARVYLETDLQQVPELPHNWHILKQKKAGQVSYYLVSVLSES